MNDATRIDELITVADKSERGPEVRLVQGAFSRFFGHTNSSGAYPVVDSDRVFELSVVEQPGGRYPRLMVTLIPVGGGALALTHRPKARDYPDLREAGVTHVVTLLAANEQAEQVGELARAAGLTWVWVPMTGAAVPNAERTAMLRVQLEQLRDRIAGGAKVVVHCSAGIHRTGMFGYALLRLLGLTADEARAKLRELREVTGAGVGKDRLAWGDGLVDS